MFPDEDVSIAYIFCDYQDRQKQTTLNLFSSLLKQTILQLKELPSEIREIYVKHNNGQRPLALEDCIRLLLSVTNRFRRSFILVDALDENFINNDEENPLQISLLDELQKLQRAGNNGRGYSMFFTSRQNNSIKQRLSQYTHHEIRAAMEDIESYARSRIRNNDKFRFAEKVRNDASLEETILMGLVEKAQDM